MTKCNADKVIKHLKKVQQLMSHVRSPYEGMSEQEIIDEIRKTRERLWKEKLTARSR